MKRALLALLLLGAGGWWLWHWLMADSGYVLVLRDGWRLETSLGFVLLLLVLAALMWSLVTLLALVVWRLLGLGKRSRWEEMLARRRLRAGFFALVAGDWVRASRLLGAAANSRDWAELALAGEIVAVAQRGEPERAAELLKQLASERRGQPLADLLAARLLVDEGALRQARARLEQLAVTAEQNPWRLQLLAEVLEREQDWPALVPLLPALREASADGKVMAARELRIWSGQLRAVAEAPGDIARRLENLRRSWKEVPAALQKKPSLRAQYAAHLVAAGDGAGAFALVRKDIERHWDDRLVEVLEQVDDVPPDTLLRQLEQWLEVRPGNLALLMCAGRTCMKAKLWGKARGFFEMAARAGHAMALAELARLYAALGDSDRALAALEQRISLLGETLPALPLPEARRPLQD